MTFQLRRLNNELNTIENYNSPYFSISPNEDNLSRWVCTIKTDNDSKYDGQSFKFEIIITARYPFNPPKVRFMSPISHPCIGPDGYLNLDILDDNWSPALSIPLLGLTICSLLNDECDFEYSKKRQIFRANQLKHELISKYLKIE